jgi:hypothetical protein
LSLTILLAARNRMVECLYPYTDGYRHSTILLMHPDARLCMPVMPECKEDEAKTVIQTYVPPAILLDADLVLLNYVAQLTRFMAERHGLASAVPWEAECFYDMPTMYQRLPRPIRTYFEEMAHDPDYYASIPFMDGAIEGVQRLRRSFPDVPVICITSGGDSVPTRAMRLENLAPLCLDAVVTLPLYSAKAAAFSTYRSGCWVVDDLPAHVLSAEEVGHHGVLFSHAYNRTAQGLRRASTWQELAAIIEAGPSPIPEGTPLTCRLP